MFGKSSAFRLSVISALLLASLASPLFSYAYGVETHYKLTENAVREYVRLGGTLAITQGDVAAMASGAVHEDELITYRTKELQKIAGLFGQHFDPSAARPVNHFYDPINNKPLTIRGVPLGLTSPLWSVDTKAQANFGVYSTLGVEDALFTAEGDYSWERNVFEYVHGDKRRALSGLGHTLHLLEDATSPAHVRNDPHPGKEAGDIDPYEEYTHNLSPQVAVTNFAVPYFSTPDEAIHKTAYFTNTNFFSKDTVTDFTLPNKDTLTKVEMNGAGYLHNRGANVLRYRKETDRTTLKEKYFYEYPEKDTIILSSNWSVLSQKSVTNSVGLIRLFEQAVEEEKRTGTLAKKNVSSVRALALNDARVLASGLGAMGTFAPTQTASVSQLLANTAAIPAEYQPETELDLAYNLPTPETLSALAENVQTTLVPLVATLPAERTNFPEQQAFALENTLGQPEAPSAPQLPIPSTQQNTSTFGGLTSLAYGSGVGGGGTATAEPVAVVLAAVPSVPAPAVPPPPTVPEPIVPVVCELPQTRNETANTCELIVPSCTSEQLLDTASNTCVALVVCTVPLVRATNNTCALSTRTGPTPLPSRFESDTTLTYSASPYISSAQGSQVITIPVGVTVTIEAGAVLKLAAETRIIVEGTLRVLGTVDYPVNITSSYDDVLAANDPVLATSLLAPELRPVTSPWAGIVVASSGTLSATHTHFAYGGWAVSGPNSEAFPRATIRNLGITTLSNVTITHSQSIAIAHEGGSFATSTLVLDTAPQGIAISAPEYDIANTVVKNMTSGSQGVIALTSLLGKVINTTGENNVFNGITFSSPNIAEGQTAHLYPNTIAYYTDTNLAVAGTLYVHPGSYMQHADSKYTVAATGKILLGDGTGDAPVMTSLWDNAQQGEPRGTVFPNVKRAPRVGDWQGVQVAEGGEVDAGVARKYNVL